MTPEQRWEKIDQTLDYVATRVRLRDEHFRKRVEQGNRNERLIGALVERMDVLTQRTIQAMDAINRLGNIAVNHENRIE